jgi:hypothetical protein
MKSVRYAVYFLMCLGIALGCQKKEEDALLASSSAPTIGTAMVFSAQSGTGFTVTWGAATDEKTAAADLKYKLVTSASDNIATAADAEANGTVVLDWTADTLTATLTSLTPSTTYYVAVLVKNEADLVAIDSGSVDTLCSGKIMFLATTTDGNFGGAAGADALCNAQKPTGFSGSTFKAMLTDGTTRRACYVSGNDNCGLSHTTGRLDWVFTANETLCSSSYAKVVGTTDSEGLLSVPNTNTLSATDTSTFTGFNVAWGSSATNCAGWTTTSGTTIAGSANAKYDGRTNNDFIAASFPSCSSAGTIYCVEQ